MRLSKRWIGAGAKLACCLTLLGGLVGSTVSAQSPPRAMTSADVLPTSTEVGEVPHVGGEHATGEHGTFGSEMPGLHEGHGEHGGHGEYGEHLSGHCEEGCEIHSEEGTGFFFEASALLIKPRRRADDFAILDSDGTTGGLVDGTVQSVDWDSDIGFRLTGGYALGHGWEIAGSYFYLHASQDRTLVGAAPGQVFATFTIPTFGVFDSAVASSNLDMDVIDLEMAKRVVMDSDLEMRFSAGARVATINQKLLTAYTGGVVGNRVFTAEAPMGMDAYGGRVGSAVAYRVAHSRLHLFATGHVSLLSASFRATNVQTVTTAGIQNLAFFLRDKYETIVPVTEMSLGLEWRGEHVRVSLGYELANWFNMVDTPIAVDNADFGLIGRRSSDLSLEGLALKVGLWF